MSNQTTAVQTTKPVESFASILQDPKPVFARIPYGKYKVRLANNDVDKDYFQHTLDPKNPWAQLSVFGKDNKEFLIDGLYTKPDSTQMIVRFIMTEGEYKDYIFTVYVSHIDFQVLLKDIVAQSGKPKALPLDIIKYMLNNDIDLFFGQQQSVDKATGELRMFNKWSAHELKPVETTPNLAVVDTDEVNILEVDDAVNM